MVLPNKLAFILGAALAVAAAIVSVLQLPALWTAGVQSVIIVLGGFGVQQLSPSAIAAKLPAHVASAATASLTALNAFLQTGVSLPTWAHAVIAAVFAAGAALGIRVTGIAVSSKAARSGRAR